MLELLLLRHAKSGWDNPELTDHERPLTKRGTKAASRMGRYLAENDLVPDLILCSDATRARATLTLALTSFDGTTPKTTIDPDLYLAEPDGILTVVRANAGQMKRVLVIGHNPGFHALALSLTKTSTSQTLARLAMKFPTAALAHLTFKVEDWSNVDAATGTLRNYVIPRELAA